MTRLRTFLIVAGLLAYAGLSTAGGLPSYYPESFNVVGALGRLDLRNGEAVIGDSLYHLSATTPVHTLTSQSATLNALAPGSLTGCQVIRDAKGRRFITEIWVLPDSYSNNQE